jgi:hypothetical protein
VSEVERLKAADEDGVIVSLITHYVQPFEGLCALLRVNYRETKDFTASSFNRAGLLNPKLLSG